MQRGGPFICDVVCEATRAGGVQEPVSGDYPHATSFLPTTSCLLTVLLTCWVPAEHPTISYTSAYQVRKPLFATP